METKVSEFKKNIYDTNDLNFLNRTLELFNFQAVHCDVYREYLGLLNIDPKAVKDFVDIPFLPIELFKSHVISVHNHLPKLYFESSGTTGNRSSRHYVYDLDFYLQESKHYFELKYGPLDAYTVFGLLPNYIEKGNSSLVAMVDHFIKFSKDANSGFYLDDFQGLVKKLKACSTSGNKVLLIGVSYALLDLIDHLSSPLSNNILVMETGGMKGRRKEMIRKELHAILQEGFGVDCIHSEYGMTELLSQAYLDASGQFQPAPWMKFLVRDIYDPFDVSFKGRGALNVVDLANVESCAFIALQDQGEVFENGKLLVNGRIDQSDIRGCNLMVI